MAKTHRTVASVAFAVAMGVAGVSHAGLDFLTDEASFDVTAAGLTVQLFPDQYYSIWSMAGTLDASTDVTLNGHRGIAPGDIIPGLAIDGNDSSPGTHAIMFVKPGYVGNANNAVFTDGLVLNLYFAPGVDTVGLGLLSYFGTSDIRVLVYDSAATLLGRMLVPNVQREGEGLFFGLQANDGDTISRITLISTSFKQAGVDLVKFGDRALQVPEPATLMLLGLGLAGLGFSRRKQ